MNVSECHHDDQPHPFVERLIGTIRRQILDRANPEKPIQDVEPRSWIPVLYNGQLLPKRQVLRSKPPLRTRRRKQRSDENPKPFEHRRKASRDL
jgi:hypothetical protein